MLYVYRRFAIIIQHEERAVLASSREMKYAFCLDRTPIVVGMQLPANNKQH